MPKPTSAAERAGPALRVVLVTMDSHLASAAERANRQLAKAVPGLSLVVHAAAEWRDDAAALKRCTDDIARGDIVIATMLFIPQLHLSGLFYLSHCRCWVRQSSGQVD